MALWYLRKKNELEDVKEKYKHLTMPSQYYLMILPTYQCNLRCWYCTQDHENLFLTSKTIERIKSLIKKRLSKKGINHFLLTWFGGEPLMSYDHLLDLTIFSRDLAQSLGKTFDCSITTNGTLLTDSRIKELREAGVTHYQITIDGTPEEHDSIKILRGASAFKTTMSNINQIAQHIHTTLRFNYTKENLKPDSIIDGINQYISEEAKSNIRFSIQKVWQEESEIDSNVVDYLINQARANGLTPSTIHHGLCYTDYRYFDCVFPNGKVGKCDNMPPNDLPGKINSEGDIIWSEDISDLYAGHLFDGRQQECQNCKYLPLYWGPCVVKREQQLRDSGKIICIYPCKDKEFANHIINIIQSTTTMLHIEA